MWVKFMDMLSGGYLKTKWEYVYIESNSRLEAEKIFEEKTDRFAYHETCDCCGNDYSVDEAQTLEAVTEYERRKHKSNPMERIPLEEYEKRADVLIVRRVPT